MATADRAAMHLWSVQVWVRVGRVAVRHPPWSFLDAMISEDGHARVRGPARKGTKEFDVCHAAPSCTVVLVANHQKLAIN